MDLAKDREHLAKHSAEAERRYRLLVRAVLDQTRAHFHGQADKAAEADDPVEHRINCMTANLVAILRSEFTQPR